MSKFVTYQQNWHNAIEKAIHVLYNSDSEYKILFEQNRNLGDTLHLIPIIRHYRTKYPNSKIAFLTAQPYTNAWEYNKDIDYLITTQKLNPQDRIKLRKKLLTINDMLIIAPSIFPYGQIWKELAWTHGSIADQYFRNANIDNMLCSRELIVELTDNDVSWAREFANSNNITKNNSVLFEYHSYSHPLPWRSSNFNNLISILNKNNIKCISVAGPGEGLLYNTIDCRGLTWRQTVALMNHVGVMFGVGSGITMLAASAKCKPKILELGVSNTISMKSCGYANSIIINPSDSYDNIAKTILKYLE